MANGLQGARIRVGLRVVAVGYALLLASCLGGPHPLPPESGVTSAGPASLPTSPTMAPTTPAQAAGSGATAASATPPVTAPPTAMQSPSAAAGSAAEAPRMPNDSGTMPPPGGFSTAGAAAPGASGNPTMPATPPSAAGAAAAGAGGTSGMGTPATCDGATAALSALEVAPRNLLFVLDRSVEMASNFDGSPRWQLSSQALMHTLSPRAKDLTLGALLYPSSARADCAAPDWLCSLSQPPMCTVNPMAAADQIAFQPAAQALGALLGSGGVYSPVMAAGVPLAESLQRADSALAAQPLNGKTAVVIVASGVPSCSWDTAKAHETVARWKSQRGVQTYVIALPGSPIDTAEALLKLAEEGGTGHVRTPNAAGALEATLQSIAFDSLSSCTLKLDPPAADPNSVRVLVTRGGVESLLPRTSASGEAQWTISADGTTVTLLGSACDAAKGGDYEGLRIVMSCAPP